MTIQSLIQWMSHSMKAMKWQDHLHQSVQFPVKPNVKSKEEEGSAQKTQDDQVLGLTY